MLAGDAFSSLFSVMIPATKCDPIPDASIHPPSNDCFSGITQTNKERRFAYERRREEARRGKKGTRVAEQLV
jgi:hypothetical protein